MGIGAGVLFNSVRPEKIESVVGSFPREGLLEVLSASVELNTSILKGEKTDANYFTLYSTPGTAVYSVDLGKIEIDCIEISKKVLIGIPTPDLRLYVEEDGGEKTFEYQKNSYTGSAQKGYETFIESRAVSYDDMLSSIQNNQELMDMAKESAKTQVTNLSLSMLPNDYSVNIYFLD